MTQKHRSLVKSICLLHTCNLAAIKYQRPQVLSSLTYDKMLDLAKWIASTDDKINVAPAKKLCFERLENTVEKREKFLLPASFRFPTTFYKLFS